MHVYIAIVKEQKALSQRTTLKRMSSRFKNRLSLSVDDSLYSDTKRPSTTPVGTDVDNRPQQNGSLTDENRQNVPFTLNKPSSSNGSPSHSPKHSPTSSKLFSSPNLRYSPQPTRRDTNGPVMRRRSFTLSWFQRRQSKLPVEPEEDVALNLPPLVLGDKKDSDIVTCFQEVRTLYLQFR